MKVFTLPGTAPVNVLLTGEPDFVSEFADRLHKNNIPFGILPNISSLDNLDLELEMLEPSIDPSVLDTMDYGEHASTIVEDLRTEAGKFTHIVDLSISPPIDRKDTIEIASLLNPEAVVMVSVLLGTATEMGMIANVDDRVTGITLVPSIITSATTVDMSRGLNTNDHFALMGEQLLTSLGYTVERVEDRVALVQMRILAMLINEAAFAVMEGVATPTDIDNAMKLGVNYPKGLLAWADEIGIAIIVFILDGLYREYHQERYRPCVLLKQYMRAGWLGTIAGRGFYSYA